MPGRDLCSRGPLDGAKSGRRRERSGTVHGEMRNPSVRKRVLKGRLSRFSRGAIGYKFRSFCDESDTNISGGRDRGFVVRKNEGVLSCARASFADLRAHPGQDSRELSQNLGEFDAHLHRLLLRGRKLESPPVSSTESQTEFFLKVAAQQPCVFGVLLGAPLLFSAPDCAPSSGRFGAPRVSFFICNLVPKSLR